MPPEPLNLEGNKLTDACKKWKQRFEVFSQAFGLSKKEEKVQTTMLLHVAGPEALDVYNTFTWQAKGDDKKVSKILEKLEAYCISCKNVTWQRHLFNTRNQLMGKSFDQYLTDLKTKAKSCKFHDLKDGLIRDRIVCGILCDKTQNRLFRETDLTLQKATDICRANEVTSTQMKSLDESGITTEPADIQAIRNEGTTKEPCPRCGIWHTKQQQCPASGAGCRKC